MAFRSVLVLAAAAALSTGAAHAEVDVVASIKPVHSLVAAVMEGVGEPHLLMEGASSPHTYAMKPSSARTLAQADVVFWVGPSLETFLARPIENLSGDARVVALLDAPGLTLLPLRAGGAFEPHDHRDDAHDHAEAGHADAHEGEDGHAHDEHTAEDEHAHEEAADTHDHDTDEHGANPHIWLDPHNAEAMVTTIAETLAAADPQNAETYRKNAAARIASLEALESEIAETLAPVKGAPFVVFHDAYPYLEARFGLDAVGSITVSPEIVPGAAQLGEIRDKIRSLGATCVFAEPQFKSRIVDVVVEGTDAHTGTLDPLGADEPAGPGQYDALMRANAASMLACLSRHS